MRSPRLFFRDAVAIAGLSAGSIALAFGCSDDPTPSSEGDAGSLGDDGGSSSGTSSGSVAPNAHGDPKTYADALCAAYESCQPYTLKRYYGDVASCRTMLLVQTTLSLGAKGNTVTQSQLEACTKKLGGRACADDFVSLAECDFRGTLEDGAACSFAGQCKSGSCVRPSDATIACGACTARAQLGADCVKAECETGLVCAAGKCAKPKAAGETCVAGNDLCVGPLECIQGTCKALLPKGATCPLELVNTCDITKNLTCMPSSSTEGVCTEWLYAQVGEKCGYDSAAHTQTLCTLSSCSSTSATGKCNAPSAAGAPCTESAGCNGSMECRGGKCVDRTPAACR